MYDHEHRERREDREIKHLPMPTLDRRQSAAMYAYLNDRELDYELAVSNGWYPTVARGSRIVIPCVNSHGFNYWQARAMGDHHIRYDSPPIPRKDSIVLLWPNYYGVRTVVITEGPMDALAAAEFYAAIAVMGGSPGTEVLDFIRKITADAGLSIIVVPDQDNFSLASKVLAEFDGVTVKTPTCKDLAGMPRWERAKLLGGV